ncbi:MAG: STAS domain-containing protein [bacterium]
MHLRIEEHDKWQICFVAGSITAVNNDHFYQLFINILQKCNKNLILNLRELEFIDSKGISTLILGKKLLAKNGLEMRISNVPPPVRNIFDITFLNRIIPIHDDMAELLGAEGMARV